MANHYHYRLTNGSAVIWYCKFSTFSVFRPLLGINAVFFYTNDIFNAAGFSAETSTMISALVGLENVFMTFVSMVLMDRMGRKSLQVYGYAIMTFL